MRETGTGGSLELERMMVMMMRPNSKKSNMNAFDFKLRWDYRNRDSF